MKYECLCLSAPDVEASKKFYQELLGLEIETVIKSPHWFKVNEGITVS